MSALAPTLQAFFTDRLLTQRQASPRTVAAYRDTLRLLLRFAQHRTGRPPSRLDLADLDADLVVALLTHLEHDGRNGVRTRNARLAAIHSLFRFAALRHPEHAELIARVLDIPTKRYDRALVCFLTPAEVDALLAAPDRSTWLGRRDHALLALAVQTGLRVSELTSLTAADLRHVLGKLELPEGEDDHRRVLAVLAHLAGSQGLTRRRSRRTHGHDRPGQGGRSRPDRPAGQPVTPASRSMAASSSSCSRGEVSASDNRAGRAPAV